MIASPIIISVAPNGARKLKADHPAVPLTPEEIAKEAKTCQEAGAALIHLHVRDAAGKHTLDADIYQQAIAAIRREVGTKLVIQITTEAVGIYTPEQQMETVRQVKPEAVSLAIKEIIPDAAHEAKAAEFLQWVVGSGILPQYILYSAEELERFHQLAMRGIIPARSAFLLFVLGRYAAGQTSTPADLQPFLSTYRQYQMAFPWAVCAFGPQEADCMIAAIAAGGHVRIGFENNIYLRDGSVAPNNAALIRQFTALATPLGRAFTTADSARETFRSVYAPTAPKEAPAGEGARSVWI